MHRLPDRSQNTNRRPYGACEHPENTTMSVKVKVLNLTWSAKCATKPFIIDSYAEERIRRLLLTSWILLRPAEYVTIGRIRILACAGLLRDIAIVATNVWQMKSAMTKDSVCDAE
jgi:hypothetical protein